MNKFYLVALVAFLATPTSFAETMSLCGYVFPSEVSHRNTIERGAETGKPEVGFLRVDCRANYEQNDIHMKVERKLKTELQALGVSTTKYNDVFVSAEAIRKMKSEVFLKDFSKKLKTVLKAKLQDGGFGKLARVIARNQGTDVKLVRTQLKELLVKMNKNRDGQAVEAALIAMSKELITGMIRTVMADVERVALGEKWPIVGILKSVKSGQKGAITRARNNLVRKFMHRDVSPYICLESATVNANPCTGVQAAGEKIQASKVGHIRYGKKSILKVIKEMKRPQEQKTAAK